MPRNVYAVIHDLHAGLEELRERLTRMREIFEVQSTTPRRPRPRKSRGVASRDRRHSPRRASP